MKMFALCNSITSIEFNDDYEVRIFIICWKRNPFMSVCTRLGRKFEICIQKIKTLVIKKYRLTELITIFIANHKLSLDTHKIYYLS